MKKVAAILAFSFFALSVQAQEAPAKEKTKKETNDRNYSCGHFAGGYDVLEDDALKKSIEKLKERKEQEPNKKK